MPGDIGENVTDPRTVADTRKSSKVPLTRAVADSARYGGLRKLTLFQLASYGDPDGTRIRPALQTVADLCGLNVRSVRRYVRGFEADGVLVQVAGARHHRAAEYYLDVRAIRPDSMESALTDRTDRTLATSDRTLATSRPDSRSPPTYQDHSDNQAPPTDSAVAGQPADGAPRMPGEIENMIETRKRWRENSDDPKYHALVDAQIHDLETELERNGHA